jgi:hypothetical protein
VLSPVGEAGGGGRVDVRFEGGAGRESERADRSARPLALR